ncbi:unnamed protein product [Arabis nemorensis]|uniref:Uncharacterized protein n=1 Tax=Arabis nemorensis TaxID=586526 RepID=A0A565B070_9BRAS|nr:unnamed protein product [Arabis nemorensis]
MDASAKAQIPVDDELDEEEGEVIDSAPPLQLREERALGASGIKKKLLKLGSSWETPELGGEVSSSGFRCQNIF